MSRLLLFCLILCGCDRNQSYPHRPITIICPWSAGGGTDRVSRQLAHQLEKELGVPVNVVNATGGGGVTGHSRGARARPDGYTLTTITPELTMLHWQGKTNITFANFQPLMSVNGDYAALFVRADSEIDSIDQLKEIIQKRKVKASGSAFGSIWHVALAGWLTSMDLKPDAIRWVSFNGSNPSLQELLAGTLDVVCCSVPEAQTLIDAKKVRCIAVMSEKRLPGLDEVPTLMEKGAKWSLSGWRGVALPKGVPKERADLILNALRKIVNGKEYREFLKKAGFGHRAGEPSQFTKTLQESDRKFGAILTSKEFVQVQQQRAGPMLMPILLASLLVLVVALAWRKGQLNLAPDSASITSEGWTRILTLLGALLFYLLAVEALGFLLTTLLIMLLLLWRFGVRWRVTIPVSLVLVTVVYHSCAVFLRVPLPWGLLGW